SAAHTAGASFAAPFEVGSAAPTAAASTTGASRASAEPGRRGGETPGGGWTRPVPAALNADATRPGGAQPRRVMRAPAAWSSHPLPGVSPPRRPGSALARDAPVVLAAAVGAAEATPNGAANEAAAVRAALLDVAEVPVGAR